MSDFYFYADEHSLEVLSSRTQKILMVGSDFGYGNFGDVLQHYGALRLANCAGGFETVSVFDAKSIDSAEFPSWARQKYGTDAIIFVSTYPLILADSDPRLRFVKEVVNIGGLFLYGGGFLNGMWGEYVLSLVEKFLRMDRDIPYWVSGQQITPPFESHLLEHLKEFRPRILGVRDEMSFRLLSDLGYPVSFSFDDATEELVGLIDRFSVEPGEGFALHLNASDYTANHSSARSLGSELSILSQSSAVGGGVTALQAFRDSRQEVFDTLETIKLLDRSFPFSFHHTVDLVGLALDRDIRLDEASLSFEFVYSCSYHVALWMQLAGVPAWLRSSNPFYDQKARALQVAQSLEDFLRGPQLADHGLNLERRAAWDLVVAESLRETVPISNRLRFEVDDDGPAPWPFYYKGQPTFQELLTESEAGRARIEEVADGFRSSLNAVEVENGNLVGRVEELEVENIDLLERLRAMSDRLTAIGDDAHRDRERATHAEFELAQRLHEIAELRSQLESYSAHLAAVLRSRSWRFMRGYRVLGRLLRGEFRSVARSITRRFRG